MVSLIDKIIVFFFLIFWFISWFIDIQQALDVDLENIENNVYPPQIFIKAMRWWSYGWDPLLIANPIWLQTMQVINSGLFGPFYFFAIYGVLKQKEWVRIPCITWATACLYSVLVITPEQLWGPHKTDHITEVFIVYCAYAFVPLFVYIRFAFSNPCFDVNNKKNNNNSKKMR